MSKVSITRSLLDDLAMSISAKSGETLPLTLAEMVEAVDGIEAGSAEPVLQAKTYTVDSAGTVTVTADSGYDGLSEVEVSVPQAAPYVYQGNQYVTQNNSRKWQVRGICDIDDEGEDHSGYIGLGTYYGNWSTYNAVPANTTVTPTTSAQTIGGANYMMEGAVTVNSIPSQYIIPTGNKAITENGTGIDVTQYATVSVDVSGGGGGTSWQTLYDGSVEVYSSSPNYFQISPYTTAFQSDQTYRVTWGQTQYLCNTITDPLGATYDGWLIGNLSIVGAGTDTGEPFIIYRNSATELTGGTTSSTGTRSLKIELQQGGGANLQTKSKTYTPTESQQTETVMADSGYDGLDEVNVTINAVSSTYVGTGITRRSSSDLTASGATVTVPSGYYSAQESKAVSSGAAGTPTASKGTVSNHSISVTPSVTNTTGYITGSTKTGTAVTVSASELVSGSETKTENGTYDVTNLAELVVNVASKNAQVVQSTTRTSASALTAIGAELTVSKTGTYDIYYSCFRTNTSSSYTWATRLYINGTAYGTAENATWTNNQQNTHLSNISLTANDKLRVYGRNTRGTSYYICAPMLAIIEA